MREVFIDNLPKHKEGNNKGGVSWSNCIGYKVKFVYDNIEGKIEILKYYLGKQRLDVKYNNDNFSIKTGNLLTCRLGELLGLHTIKYKYNIEEVIDTKHGKIQILEQIRIPHGKSTQKGYKYKCLIDGNIDKINENDLKIGKGCNVCTNKKVLKGVNDIATTHIELARMFANVEDTYTHTYSSGKSIDIICPDCGYIKNMQISNLYIRGFFCPKCSDGKSYPEKFAFSFLEQLISEYEYEYDPDWIKPKRYDFYFELNNKKYIIEMDGDWHNKSNNMSKLTIEEVNEIDDYKDKMAEEHGIEVIRIDCKYSDINYIKNNIITSRLNNILDLSKIDWLKCHEYACSNRVKEACSLWNNKVRNTVQIGKIMKLVSSTVVKYLKQGTKLGWCDYDPKKSMEDTYKRIKEKFSRSVIQLSKENDFINEWVSMTDVKNELNIDVSIISACCGKKRHNKTAGGFKWMYKEDYDLPHNIPNSQTT